MCGGASLSRVFGNDLRSTRSSQKTFHRRGKLGRRIWSRLGKEELFRGHGNTNESKPVTRIEVNF